MSISQPDPAEMQGQASKELAAAQNIFEDVRKFGRGLPQQRQALVSRFESELRDPLAVLTGLRPDDYQENDKPIIRDIVGSANQIRLNTDSRAREDVTSSLALIDARLLAYLPEQPSESYAQIRKDLEAAIGRGDFKEANFRLQALRTAFIDHGTNIIVQNEQDWQTTARNLRGDVDGHVNEINNRGDILSTDARTKIPYRTESGKTMKAAEDLVRSEGDLGNSINDDLAGKSGQHSKVLQRVEEIVQSLR